MRGGLRHHVMQQLPLVLAWMWTLVGHLLLCQLNHWQRAWDALLGVVLVEIDGVMIRAAHSP